jgi:PAS domain S-box-containing protein
VRQKITEITYTSDTTMNTKYKIATFSIFCGMSIWLIDALLDYSLFYEKSFLKLLIFDVPNYEIYTRLSLIAWFLMFSILILRVLTEQKQVERALRESEEKYRDLLENANDLIQSVDANKNFVYVNRRWKEVLGYSDEEIKKLKLTDILRPDQIPKCMDIFKRVCKGEAINNIETVFVSKNGCEIYVEGSVNAHIKDGRFIATRGIFRDITDRKRAERALRESEEKYRLVVENANEAIIVIQDEILRFVNPKTTETTGYSKDELISRPFVELIHPDDRKMVSEHLKRLESEKSSDVYSFRIVDKKGNIKWLEVSSVLINWDDRPATLNFLSDVTERKQAEEELRKSEQKYRTTFEHTGTAMTIVEEDTTISLANTEFERLSGYRKEEIEGKISWTDFAHPEDVERMKGYHYARREGKEAPKKYEFRFIDKEGNVKDVFLTVDILPGTKKSVASLIDITYLKRLNRLLKISSEINELVAKEKSPEVVLKAVCEKLNLLYDAVFTCLISKELEPVETRGLEINSVKRVIESCPSISKALKGEIAKLRMNDRLCKHCTVKPHRYVLSFPLIHDKAQHGIITIHSSSDFSEDEVELLQKLSSNISFALSAYEVEREKKRAIEQLAANLLYFEHSEDRLRNPLAVIMNSLELKDELGKDEVFRIVNEQVKRLKEVLDEMRKDEVKTYRLIEESMRKV